jgi:hypothetical protein
MRYKPKSAAAFEIALGGLPNSMRVEVDPDVGVSAKTVGERRFLLVGVAVRESAARHEAGTRRRGGSIPS